MPGSFNFRQRFAKRDSVGAVRFEKKAERKNGKEKDDH